MKIIFIFLSWMILQSSIENIQLKTLEGKKISIQQYDKYKATVIYFISPECPLCQSYSLTINQIKKQYEAKGFRFFAIVSGTYFNALQVEKFVKEYEIKIPVYRDEKIAYAKQLHASITPEVFVMGKSMQTLYSGRIDNWAYELSRKRKVITEHNLQEALNAIDKNQPIKNTKTKAVGCFIE